MVSGLRSMVCGMVRRWRKTMLTLIGIAIGVCAVVVIQSIGSSSAQAVSAELQSLGLGGVLVSRADKSQALTPRELRVLKQSGVVDYVMPVHILMTTGMTNTLQRSNVLLFGVDEGVGQVVSMRLLEGRMLRSRDLSERTAVCIVDEAMLNRLDSSREPVGQKMVITVSGREYEFEIVGVIRSNAGFVQDMMGEYAPSLVYVPYSTLQEMAGLPENQQVVVKTNRQQDEYFNEYLRTLLHKYAGNGTEYEINSLAQQQDSLYGVMDLITAVLTLIGGISLLVACLNIMTTMLVAVQERTREIGIKKSIGAGSGVILAEFLLESVLLTAAGSALGIAAGWLAVTAAGLQVPPGRCVLIAGVTSACGALFGAYPAYRAARMRPIDALKSD